MRGRFLIATDGSPSAEGALRLGLQLSRKGAPVEVLSVLDASPPVTELGMEVAIAAYQAQDAAALESRRAQVAEQIGALGPDAGEWPLLVEIGAPGPTIARLAKERGASTIVVGLQPRNRIQRLIRSETALSVVHLTDLPVLAVHRNAADLPRRVLVGLDFNDASGDALHPALPLLGQSPTLHLAHVAWETSGRSSEETEQWRKTYLYGAASRLEEVAGRLWADAEIHVETHLATGNTEEELLALAERLNVDLISAGTHAYGLLHRALIPSVSSGLLRRAPCSVLLTPTHLRAEPAPDTDANRPVEPIPWI